MRLHLPDCAPWYALLGRAQVHTGILLDVPLEGYLVTLMQRALLMQELDQEMERIPDPLLRLQAMAEHYLLTATLLPRREVEVEDSLVLARECYRQLARLEEEGRFAPVLEQLDALAGVLVGVRELNDAEQTVTSGGWDALRGAPERGSPPPLRDTGAFLPAGSLSH